jgi:hypothetical protein
MRLVSLAILTLPLAAGCSMGASARELDADPMPAGGSGPSNGAPPELAFLGGRTDLAPRQEVTLTVQATPPANYRVRFALPQTDGANPLDAVLDQSEVTTDQHGQASVRLTAPSTSTQFRVRASVDSDVFVQQDFEVTETGTVTVVVHAIHPSHMRFVTTWTASARPNETCAEQPSLPAPDGEITAEAGRLEAPKLTGVPAGVPVAITLRAGHFVGGCTSIDMFPPGPAERQHDVEVTLLNRPIELAQSNVALSLDLQADDLAFRELNQAASQSALLALRGSSTDDADALLDTMRNTLTGDARQALDSARKAEDWDALVRAHWATPTRLHDTVSEWLTVGGAALNAQQPLLSGRLQAVDAQSAELTLAAAAGLEPEQAGFVSSALFSWNADAADTLLLGGDLYLSSSRLATGLALAPSLDDFPQAETAEQALALALDCSVLGSVLAAAGTDGVMAYPACNAACLSELCEQASASLWLRARDATSTKPVRLALSATGAVSVGDAAEVEAITGSWVGELANASKPTGGSLTANSDPP